jgi:hypothetical protein
MSSELLIDSDKMAIVEAKNGQHWLRLALWLGEEFQSGQLVRLARDTTVSIEGLDPLSSSYDRANWLSGVSSGALYAYRALHIARQRTVVTELSGQLEAADMDAVSSAAALAISALANKELPNLSAEGWSRQTRLTERPAGESTDENDITERAH